MTVTTESTSRLAVDYGDDGSDKFQESVVRCVIEFQIANY